jgi:hypothetical protein
MAVFRVERTRDYTVMSNYHLKDAGLSLKSKGLLSVMLSLPDSWNYTTRGLAAICKEGVDSIGGTLKELEKMGYIVRTQLRDARGRITDTEYVIYEQPKSCPDTPSPDTENPDMDAPDVDTPYLEPPAQLNTKVSNTQRSMTYGSRTHSFVPLTPSADRRTDILAKREDIKRQIEYDHICDCYNREQIDEFVEIMLEVAMTRSPNIKIGRDSEYPTAFVQHRFEQITSNHIEKVLDGIRENTTRVWNAKAYLLAALFNAPSSLDNHYTMLVNHDMHSG